MKIPATEREHLLVILENNSYLPNMVADLTGSQLWHFFSQVLEGIQPGEAVAILRSSQTCRAAVPIEHCADFIHEHNKDLAPALRVPV